MVQLFFADADSFIERGHAFVTDVDQKRHQQNFSANFPIAGTCRSRRSRPFAYGARARMRRGGLRWIGRYPTPLSAASLDRLSPDREKLQNDSI